ncbi:hypothetical protein [Arcticibacter eurypsychrophilus]|uniref:hypothetical protein n=1 Tax=Arcticibacter eurypsychrophilus TaxID=1434752 RepID=UPI00084CF5BD|nr:hypothetical protein [Arcticibacter eurypsychrophilus]
MKVTVEIRYEQLLAAIKKLPAAKIKQLRLVLDDALIYEKASEDLSDFQSFLLKGPVMKEEQYKQYQADRKYFNQWRTK